MQYSVLQHFLSQEALAGGPFCTTSTIPPDSTTHQQCLLAYFRLLHAAPDLITAQQPSWDPVPLHATFSATTYSIPTRLLALRVFAAQERLGEASRIKLEEHWIGKPGLLDASREDGTVDASLELNEAWGAKVPLDLWTLHLAELERVQNIWTVCASQPVTFLSSIQEVVGDGMDVDEEAPRRLGRKDLSPLVVDIGGILLFRSGSNGGTFASSASTYIETASSIQALRDLALHLSARLPVLLSGPPSSGKTHLLSHLSSLVHGSRHSSSQPRVLSIQLGDQSGVDAKALLGSFISSPTRPGTFEWSEGALTRAVRLGLWVVLEDVDRAGGEVLSVVGRLVEQLGPTGPIGSRPTLDLGTRGKIVAGEGFALFATRSVAPSNSSQSKEQYPAPTFLGHEHWAKVSLTAPTHDDVRRILGQSFPKLAQAQDGALDRLVTTWTKIGLATAAPGRKGETVAGGKRGATLRDLIKWCRRVENLLGPTLLSSNPFANPVQQEEIFIEACDVFLGSVPPPLPVVNVGASTTVGAGTSAGKAADRYSALVEVLAEELGMGSERAWWALSGRTPEIQLRSSESSEVAAGSGETRVRIGRVELPRLASRDAAPISKRFALTRPSRALLERLAVSAALSEPVLMVGETGTGKTTVVQHLASMLGRPLVALNLSQQTESADLLGAFKPLDPKVPATELHNEWTQLFERTFSARRNARFVDAERKAFVAGRWARLAGLWRESARMAAARKTARKSEDAGQVAGSSAEAVQAPRKKRRTDKGTAEGSPSEDADAEAALDAAWTSLEARARDFEIQHGSKKCNFVFSFIEGPLVKALRRGDWVLLDEVNLAAAETLDCLAGLLESPTSSVVLTERGDLAPIPRHPNFRLFACMNPATDVGKKDLPPSLRARFTELYVPSPDSDQDALTSIVEKHIGAHAAGDRAAVLDAAELYAAIRQRAAKHELADGANQRPHYSIRTLARALGFAADAAPTYGLRRALYEGFLMAFMMLLDNASADVVRGLIERHTLARAKNSRQVASFVPPPPPGADEGQSIRLGPFWLESGPLPLDPADDYVLTPSVQAKVVGLARTVLTRRFPVLIQGPTSAGKTSAVEYLARRTGHRFVRINNHEHTDIQEYLGTYASDPDSGRLVFHEGLLVRALRRGDWIVLDELNLAPTDVLEALNRLLDDNRELLIPETQEIVRPHPHFMLFATQNPPGLYAGRKVLSRAFRNRFLEVHFDDVPRPELETILHHRCALAPSYASKIVAVFVELQRRRQAGRVFETKQAFVTLRDLFRWGIREAIGYQQLAENGYMLLAERARRTDDRAVVKEVIEQVMKVRIDELGLYDLRGSGREAVAQRVGAPLVNGMLDAAGNSSIVWTRAMQRLLCLVATALRYNEPVLLVGETGAGKTSVCELVAAAFGVRLHAVNCHQNTDTADLLGGQRPLRNRAARQAAARVEAGQTLVQLGAQSVPGPDADLEEFAQALGRALANFDEAVASASGLSKAELQHVVQRVNGAMALFEWHDGPLVEAMRSGEHLLLDEISLADDSVLERLNSVLEPGRTLVLAERSTAPADASDPADPAASQAQMKARVGFQVVATMNPGGDYGKKELSPALRNRFTEIWVPALDAREDLKQIVDAAWKSEDLKVWTDPLLDYAEWIAEQLGGREQAGVGLRDLLAWVAFVNAASATSAIVAGSKAESQVREDGSTSLSPAHAFAHGALLAIVDGLGALPATAAMTPSGLSALRTRCFFKLSELVAPEVFLPEAPELLFLRETATSFAVGPFGLPKGPLAQITTGSNGANGNFSLGAETTAGNALRVLRALRLPRKAVLLEGSPGAGKTSLITALARATGNPLARINLSDQTELVDLFGSDLPVEGGKAGEFAWKDAAFLRAMQEGEW